MTFAVIAGISIPAEANQSVVPGPIPLANQPRVMDGRIYAIDTRGNSVIVGGTFTRIRNATGTEITQRGIFKFNVSTGQIDKAFRPTLNGKFEGNEVFPDGQFIYAAGSFTTVNGSDAQPRRQARCRDRCCRPRRSTRTSTTSCATSTCQTGVW